uniref:T-complex 11 n=1 Tax=Nannospalax galili TaxID=1026970 RepID=A0A8C6R4I7_NANGA
MPKERAARKDPGVAEGGSRQPSQESQARDECVTEKVNEVSNHDPHVEEKALSPSRLEDETKDTMHSDFWDHLKEQLPEIKEILLPLLLPRQNRLRSEMEEALDMDFLNQQAERGDLNVPYLSKYILNMMVLLCSPVRDEAVQKLENITDPVRLLRGIFRVLGLMKMDMVNYTIQSLQPQLQEHSIQYERAKFQELLNKQPSLLNHTTKWLTQA